MATEPARVGVLIDADNASADHAAAIFTEAATFGDAVIRRLYYGDNLSAAWTELLSVHSIEPRWQPGAVKGKNAADIALAIEAVDLRHTGNLDVVIIVSSDSDFTFLAQYLRAADIKVIGIGGDGTVAGYRAACTTFVPFAELTANRKPVAKLPPPEPAPRPGLIARLLGGLRGGRAAPAEPRRPVSNPAKPATRAKKTKKKTKLAAFGERAMTCLNTCNAVNGWVRLSTLGAALRKAEPGFEPRHYGHPKLVLLLEATGLFEIRKEGTVDWLRPAVKGPAAP